MITRHKTLAEAIETVNSLSSHAGNETVGVKWSEGESQFRFGTATSEAELEAEGFEVVGPQLSSYLCWFDGELPKRETHPTRLTS